MIKNKQKLHLYFFTKKILVEREQFWILYHLLYRFIFICRDKKTREMKNFSVGSYRETLCRIYEIIYVV